ncbi:MAG: hypothetical protein E6G22_01845 [Actinobacteria bacterium]|nr:MAG: hypothetical protein E6G22_01845 [Actinomycetota bacterium]
MAAIVETVEIAKSPQEVFAYLDDLSRHGEWQGAIESVELLTEGPTRVGSRAVDTRRVPGGRQRVTYEITEHDPPRRAAFRGLDGPIRPLGSITVEPLDDGRRSRVTLELDLVGHGMGKLLAPLARRDARKHVPQDQARLKERLESGAAQ